MEAQAGTEESVLDEKVETAAGFQVYQRIARFSKAPMRVMVQWTLGADGQVAEPHLHYDLQDSGEFGKGRGLPAPFTGYVADGKPVDRGEPVKGQTIESGSK